eukprot:sb/3471683/
MLNPGDSLRFRCARGYTPSGSASCLIQNVFTNEAHDARLTPECIQVDTSNTFTGTGEDYAGTTSTTLTGKTCMNWNKVVLEGQLYAESRPGIFALGNHNMCRNPGGKEAVPWCFAEGDKAATVSFCFPYPGCDVCTGAPDRLRSCDASRCQYKDTSTSKQSEYFWQNCHATCCAAAGCI